MSEWAIVLRHCSPNHGMLPLAGHKRFIDGAWIVVSPPHLSHCCCFPSCQLLVFGFGGGGGSCFLFFKPCCWLPPARGISGNWQYGEWQGLKYAEVVAWKCLTSLQWGINPQALGKHGFKAFQTPDLRRPAWWCDWFCFLQWRVAHQG